MDLRNKINFKKTFKKIKIYSNIMKYILITKVENSEPIIKNTRLSVKLPKTLKPLIVHVILISLIQLNQTESHLKS